MRKRSNLSVMAGLLRLIRPMLSVILGAICAGLLGHVCATLIPLLGAQALLTAAGSGALPVVFIIALLVCGALRALLRYLEQYSNHFIAFKLLAEIRGSVFKALRRLSPAKLDGRDSGDLIALITGDIEYLELFYAHTISPVVIAAVYSIAMLIFFLTLHPLLTLPALAGYLIVGVVIPLVSSKAAQESGAESRDKFAGLNSYILDSLRGLPELIQYCRGEDRTEGLRERTKGLLKVQKRMASRGSFAHGVTDAVIICSAAAVLFLGVWLNRGNHIPVSSVVLAAVAMLCSFGPVTALSNLSGGLSLTLACGERVLDLLDEKPIVEDVDDGKDIDFSGAECNNLRFSYGDNEILRDLSAAFPRGSVTGVTGPSGSGKSTLLKLLMRFRDADSGAIYISDTDIRRVNTESLRTAEGFVAQETQLFNESIADNILIAKPAADREAVIEAAQKASLHEFVMTLPNGYDTVVGELGGSLSGGERQRVGLARAFLSGAPFLLLDEPTSSLDSLNEGVILKAVRENAERSGQTVALVSHRTSTMRIADRTYSAENGRVS